VKWTLRPRQDHRWGAEPVGRPTPHRAGRAPGSAGSYRDRSSEPTSRGRRCCPGRGERSPGRGCGFVRGYPAAPEIDGGSHGADIDQTTSTAEPKRIRDRDRHRWTSPQANKRPSEQLKTRTAGPAQQGTGRCPGKRSRYQSNGTVRYRGRRSRVTQIIGSSHAGDGPFRLKCGRGSGLARASCP